MGSYRREIQTKLLKYGSLKEILRKNGVLTIFDFAISRFLDVVSKRFYTNSGDYSLSEVFFRSRDIDRWSRYIHVTNEIRKIKGKKLSVLNVNHDRYSSGYFSLKNYVAKGHFDDVIVENPLPRNVVPEPAPIIISLLFVAVFATYALIRHKKPSINTKM